MSNDQSSGPSTLLCALVGLGGAAVVFGGLHLLASKTQMFGALHGALGELERATNDYDAAFLRLLAAEEALEPFSAAFMATEWGSVEQDELLPRLRAHQAEVKAAKAEVAAAMKRMREWGEVARLERKPATTEEGRQAVGLLNELEDLFRPSSGN